MTKELDIKDVVTACYLGILGREPENQEVVDAQATFFETPQAAIEAFLQSTEFQARHSDVPIPIELAANYAYDRLDIEVDVSPDQLAQMFARIAGEWKALGETDPHWSVITADQYRGERLQDNLEAFYASGQPNVTWMQNIAKRNGVTLGAGQTCFELGCGVGRVTLPLADLFDHVHGYDISPGNLAEANAMIRARGTDNITLTQLSLIEDIQSVPAFDVLFTVIVLQHNPPPVQAYMLDALLSKLRPGGVAYFQLPTYIPEYSFDAQSYLASDPIEMEMHAVPMRHVTKMLRDRGCDLLEVVQDNFTGMPGSHTFLAVKSDA